MSMMPCPQCGVITAVIDSRLVQRRMAIRRRRSCPNCGNRMTTYETAVEAPAPERVLTVTLGDRVLVRCLAGTLPLAVSNQDAKPSPVGPDKPEAVEQ